MELPESMVRSSNLTPKQVESLTSYVRVRSHETTLREAAASRSSGEVKIGSYYRTVQQGRDNIRSSIITVLIALWSGFVKGDDLRRLLDQTSKGLPELEERERSRVVSLVEALVDKIVM